MNVNLRKPSPLDDVTFDVMDPFSLLCEAGKSLLNGACGLADDKAMIDSRFTRICLDVLKPCAGLVEGISRDVGVGQGFDPGFFVADVVASGTGLTNSEMLQSERGLLLANKLCARDG